MDNPTIEIISDSFIKPKFESEESKKPVFLSPWDLVMISMNYIQKGLLFRLPENQDFSITTFLDDLKDSLSATLTHFHPLAARLSVFKQEDPPSVTFSLNHEKSPGARFIHTHTVSNLTLDDILTHSDDDIDEVDWDDVEMLFDHIEQISYDGLYLSRTTYVSEMSLLSVMVTQLVDGVFIGCSINHMVADETSFWHFLNSWSEMFKSKSQLDNISRPPVLNRWIPEGSDPPIAFPFTREDLHNTIADRYLMSENIFRFSADSLAKLKAKVNSECDTTKISTLQALSALVWRCVTRARQLPEDQETGCLMAVDNRNRLSPPLPENYFGNMVQTVKSITTVGELLDHGVGWSALLLHEAVASHGDKEIKEMMDAWVKSPFMVNGNVDFGENNVHMWSSPRFDVYGNEFGLGKAIAVLSGYANKFDGKVTLYPGREGGGSIDLEVCLFPMTMDYFEDDEEFMSVVNE